MQVQAMTILTTPQSPTVHAKFHGPTMLIQSLDSIRFHKLLNSLPKVPFHLPSRYSSPIGLVLALDGDYYCLSTAFAKTSTPKKLKATSSDQRTGLTPVFGKATIRCSSTSERNNNRLPVCHISHLLCVGGSALGSFRFSYRY